MMSHSRIPLAIPDLRGRELQYLSRCVTENWVSSAGPFVTELEAKIAALSGRAQGVATVNGTTAIQLALIAVGVRPGQCVVVPDWTFAATANAVIHAGAVPYFHDVTESAWTLDPQLLAETLADPGHDVAAVIAVHTLGHPADMDSIRAACSKAGIPLVEDAAGAIGALYKGRPAGGLGDIGIFSFNGNKTITAGGGGMVLTDNAETAAFVRHLSAQGRVGAEYQHDVVGYNYRMTNLNAAVGLAQLERLSEMLGLKVALAARYDDALKGRHDLTLMPRQPWAQSSCWLYSVATASDLDAASLVAHLAEHDIEARVFWRSLSHQKPYASAPRRLNGVSRRLSGRVVSLPCSSGLSRSDHDRVLSALSRWRGTPADRVA
jgi:perosamine synthetase